MASRHFDFVVIGGGSAGYAAARTARESFDKVAILDGAEDLGGLCILRGCMPSKTLIYLAEIAHLVREASKFGVIVPEPRIDMAAVHQRKLTIIEEFASYRRQQMESGRYHLIRDRATFVNETTVVLEKCGEHISADHFLIATGSLVATPDVPGLAETPHWTSDEVLDLDFLPASVIVLGGGIVACEMAQFLRRVGSRVIQIQRGASLLKETSHEAAAVVGQAFRDEGIEWYTDTELIHVGRDGDEAVVKFSQQGAHHEVRAAHLFSALGRKPNSQHLGLRAAGVKTHNSGHIQVNAMQQTDNPRIYAAGDVTGPHEIVHLAILQAEIAAKHASGKSPEPLNYDHRTTVVFTDPQIAMVGIPIADAKKRGLDVIAAEYPFNDHGKSILMEAKYGYVKVWANRATGKIIGAECVGKDAGELIHSMAVGVTLGVRPADLLKVQWYHPTLSEIWTYPLEELVEAL